MHFWKIDKIVEDLKEDKVTSLDELLYMLIFLTMAVWLTVHIDLLKFFTLQYSYDFYLELSFMVLAIFYIYWINKQGDNKNFIKRFITLSVPIFFYILIILIFINQCIGYIDEPLYRYDKWLYNRFHDLLENGYFHIVVDYLVKVTFFIYLSINMKQVSTKPHIIVEEENNVFI